MYDLLAPVSICMVYSVWFNNLPFVYPCPEIGNFSSALITYSLVISVLPKYVVLKSVLSSKLVTCDISACTPSYLSRYVSLILSSSKYSCPVSDLHMFLSYCTVFCAFCLLMVLWSHLDSSSQRNLCI